MTNMNRKTGRELGTVKNKVPRFSGKYKNSTVKNYTLYTPTTCFMVEMWPEVIIWPFRQTWYPH